jgi:hypothetical protein
MPCNVRCAVESHRLLAQEGFDGLDPVLRQQEAASYAQCRIALVRNLVHLSFALWQASVVLRGISCPAFCA